MTDVFSMPTHPAADVFPMLADDELDELAADIKANGLVHPLIVKDGVLIDGRNRREACRRAGVEPRVEDLNGADPVVYIISSNIKRRHMNKGQQAMATAMIYPEAATLKRKGAGSLPSKDQVSEARVSQARAVLQWARELADAVLAGAQPLNVAYDTAIGRKRAAEGPKARLEVLTRKAPDLAEQVVNEQLKLEEAEGALRARNERERAERQAVYDGLDDLARSFDIIATPEARAYLVEIVTTHDERSRSETFASLQRWHSLLTSFFEEHPTAGRSAGAPT